MGEILKLHAHDVVEKVYSGMQLICPAAVRPRAALKAVLCLRAARFGAFTARACGTR